MCLVSEDDAHRASQVVRVLRVASHHGNNLFPLVAVLRRGRSAVAFIYPDKVHVKRTFGYIILQVQDPRRFQVGVRRRRRWLRTGGGNGEVFFKLGNDGVCLLR